MPPDPSRCVSTQNGRRCPYNFQIACYSPTALIICSLQWQCLRGGGTEIWGLAWESAKQTIFRAKRRKIYTHA